MAKEQQDDKKWWQTRDGAVESRAHWLAVFRRRLPIQEHDPTTADYAPWTLTCCQQVE
ncbi:MAG: hypothetical protein Q8O55_07995 [Dehalococcoidales bacterium]|nr:hypothetical protein [Dehalococcoidales bacterium]